jgi:hypothetical protein
MTVVAEWTLCYHTCRYSLTCLLDYCTAVVSDCSNGPDALWYYDWSCNNRLLLWCTFFTVYSTSKSRWTAWACSSTSSFWHGSHPCFQNNHNTRPWRIQLSNVERWHHLQGATCILQTLLLIQTKSTSGETGNESLHRCTPVLAGHQSATHSQDSVGLPTVAAQFERNDAQTNWFSYLPVAWTVGYSSLCPDISSMSRSYNHIAFGTCIEIGCPLDLGLRHTDSTSQYCKHQIWKFGCWHLFSTSFHQMNGFLSSSWSNHAILLARLISPLQ